MRYLPHTDADIATMLDRIGVNDLSELFAVVPEETRRTDDLNLPGPLTEWELNERIERLASTMGGSGAGSVFIGAGCYEHFIPASVAYLLSRSELSTAYTPYQPELSQGTLQAIYEYQTLTSRLLGMETANASLYDGATALAEALLMAIRVSRKSKVAVSRAVHPHYRQVVETYLRSTEYEIVDLPYAADGRTDLSGLADTNDLAAVAVQSPNFFGCIEDIGAFTSKTSGSKALTIVTFSEPLAYGLLKSPGSLGADIACGEGRSFGIPQWFGGPGLGMFATTMKYVRNMPGRLVGQTTDRDGKRGFVLTLATREQHIRREKATSNICTNNSLCAVNAAMYMASLGSRGLRELALLNHDKSEYLKSALAKAGIEIPFSAPTFNEFVARMPEGFEAKHAELLQKGIVAGIPVAPYYPDLAGCYLLCATEVHSKQSLDDLVKEMTR